MARASKSKRFWAAAFAATLASFAPTAEAQHNELEGAVKATFLTRFGSFVDWPTHAFTAPDAPFVLCISGPARFADVVQHAAAGERILNRTVVVQRIDTVSRGTPCHILFLGGVAGQDVRAGLDAVRGSTMLTVTDEVYGPARGAIHFVVVDGRVRFHVDRGTAEQNGLGLSSRLLAIALTVRRHGSAG